MSDGYKNGAFAVGLVVCGGIVLNLALWLDYNAEQAANHSADSQNKTDYSQVGQLWDGFLRTFVTPSDTLAQWIMAVFTICATIVLVFTLRSANRTNAAAIKASTAAIEANNIMRNEQRPWVTLERELFCDANDFGRGLSLSWNYNLTNKGKSPAYDVKLDWLAVKGRGVFELQDACKEYAA